jgi:hypothetical protein
MGKRRRYSISAKGPYFFLAFQDMEYFNLKPLRLKTKPLNRFLGYGSNQFIRGTSGKTGQFLPGCTRNSLLYHSFYKQKATFTLLLYLRLDKFLPHSVEAHLVLMMRKAPIPGAYF